MTIKDDRPPRVHNGLSPSSLQLYQQCPRRYYHKKVAATPMDLDASENVESLMVGKAFHKCLELTRHDLTGYTMAQAREVVVGLYELSEEFHLPLVMAMLAKYKIVHERSKLQVVATEHVIDTPEFYGIVDVVLVDDSLGLWWIGDMKTAASLRGDLIPSLPSHLQLNLYADHHLYISAALDLGRIARFAGCRYRLTTKSKLSRREGESTGEFFKRLYGSVKSYDFPIHKPAMNMDAVYSIHTAAKRRIDEAGKDEEAFNCNFDSCQAYFRPCEFWSKCHGANYSEMKGATDAIYSG